MDAREQFEQRIQGKALDIIDNLQTALNRARAIFESQIAGHDVMKAEHLIVLSDIGAEVCSQAVKQSYVSIGMGVSK